MEVNNVKYKVIKKFRDKFTKIVFEENHIYETNNKERAEYLIKLGYLGEEIKERKESKKKVDNK